MKAVQTGILTLTLVNQIVYESLIQIGDICIPLHVSLMDRSLESHSFGVAIAIDAKSVKIMVIDDLAIGRKSTWRQSIDVGDSHPPNTCFSPASS
jgi:hypothetical protein